MKSKFKLILLAFLFVNQSSFAQWEQTSGPEGGNTEQIVQIGSVLFISAEAGGVYKSTNNGIEWVACNNGLPDDTHVNNLVAYIDTLYIVLSYGNGIYKSIDLGQNWFPVNNGIEDKSFNVISVGNLGIYTQDRTNKLVYYSSDGGQSWDDISSGINSTSVYCFLETSSDVYATGGNSLYKLSGDGISWETVDLDFTPVNYLYGIFQYDGVFYLSESLDLVYVSKDNGITWTKTPLRTNSKNNCIDHSGDSVFVTTSEGRIFYTIDKGSSWSLIQNEKVLFADDAFFSDNRIIMSSDDGIFISDDEGITWNASNRGLRNVRVLTFNQNDEYIFAGNNNRGIYKKSKNNDIWENITPDEFWGVISDIVVVDSKLFAGNAEAIYLSEDNGETWTENFNAGFGKNSLALDFDNGIFASAIYNDGVYISTDTAKTWELAANENLIVNNIFLSMEVVNDTIILTTTNGDVFISINRGDLWENRRIPNYGSWIHKVIYHNGIIYLGTNEGMYLSNDLGTNWSKLGDFSSTVYDMVIDSEKIYIATYSGAYYTSFGRDNWYTFNEGLPFENNFLLSIYADEDSIYCGLDYESVWSCHKDQFNLPPIIIKVDTITTNENTSVDLNWEVIVIDDIDNTYPDDYTLAINNGDNYTVIGTTILPNNDYIGYLTVPITVNDGLVESNVYNVIVDVQAVSGIKDQNEFAFKVYPNPAIDYLKISMDNELFVNLKVQLIKLDGTITFEKIFDKRDRTLEQNIELTNISAGIYLLKIITNDGMRSVQRIVID